MFRAGDLPGRDRPERGIQHDRLRRGRVLCSHRRPAFGRLLPGLALLAPVLTQALAAHRAEPGQGSAIMSCGTPQPTAR